MYSIQFMEDMLSQSSIYTPFLAQLNSSPIFNLNPKQRGDKLAKDRQTEHNSEKENYSNSGQVSPILMNLSGVAQKNFSYYNKDNIDLNRFFEKMTFQDLYNDFAEENTPTHSSSNILQSSSSSMNQQQQSQMSNSTAITPNHLKTQNSSQMPLQEYSNNYQNMNYRHKVSLQSQSSFCSQASTSSSSMSFTNATTYQANPFSNITNIKKNNATVITSQGNTPSHFNTAHSQHQQHLQNIPYHKQTSLKMDKRNSKSVKLKNAIDEFFARPLDSKFQQKLGYQTSCSYPPTLSVTPIPSYSEQNVNNNTYDLFSNSTSNSCYSLFMSQQNSQNLSECDTNSEFSVY